MASLVGRTPSIVSCGLKSNSSVIAIELIGADGSAPSKESGSALIEITYTTGLGTSNNRAPANRPPVLEFGSLH